MSHQRTARIEEVAEVFGGGTPSRSEAKYFGGDVPWATPTDVTALDDLYIGGTKESLTEDGLRNSSSKLMPAGAVLLTSRATIGFTAVSRMPICTNQGFINFVCGPDLVPEYLAYWLRTQKPKLIQHAGGTTFKEVARGTVRKFQISFPAPDEQRRIVDIISRAEGIVRLRREADLKADKLVPALFVEMLGDPATNPRKWPVRRVSDVVASFAGGKNIQAGSERGSAYRILKISAVTRGTYLESESKPAPDGYVPPPQHVVRAGDLLFSRANTEALVGATAFVEETNGTTLLPDKLWRFVWAEPAEPHYYLALFQNAYVRGALGRLSTGTSASMRNISQAKLFSLTLPIAPIEHQRQFSERVAQVRAIHRQQAEATLAAEATFGALLARAFGEPSSGEGG